MAINIEKCYISLPYLWEECDEEEDFHKLFPYPLPIYEQLEGNHTRGPVGTLLVDFDTYNQMDSESLSGEGTLQHDYYMENYDKIIWNE